MERQHDRGLIKEQDVEIIDQIVCDGAALPRLYVFRQVLISTAIWTNFFTLGLCLGSPTVIVPQLRRDANSSDIISEETVSWLSSSTSYSGMLQVVVLAALPRYMGRKNSFLLVSAVAVAGFTLMYFAKTVTQLLISAIINGVLTASHITISIMIITEYSSPQFRGVFLTTKSASFLWGVWVANIIGTFFHWKYIALVGWISTVYILLVTVWLPESPLWLASKGRFEECATAHHWLKGDCPKSGKELDDLINFYKERQIINNNKQRRRSIKFKAFFGAISKRGFYKPLLLVVLVNLLYNSLGKMTCTVYAYDILSKLTSSEPAAYSGMLILDGVTLAGAYVGSGVSKVVQRKPLLLLTSGVGIVFLYLLSLYIFLGNLGILDEDMYISCFLLSVYSLAVSSGPVIMASSLISELIPLTHRNAFTLTIGIMGNFLFATFLKVAPFLFTLWGFAGMFLFYAVLSTIFLITLHVFLPETKDKTLLEIEIMMTEK